MLGSFTFESELDAAWVRFLEEENVLSFGLTEHETVEAVAEEASTAQQSMNNNERYLQAVAKNSLTANVQAQQHLNYAGSQREMMKLNKSYGKMVERAGKLLEKYEREENNEPPQKIVYLNIGGVVKKRKVSTYTDLLVEGAMLAGGTTSSSHTTKVMYC